MKKHLAIIGAGGQAKEIANMVRDINNALIKPNIHVADYTCYDVTFFVDDDYLSHYPEARPLSELDILKYVTVVGIGDSKQRSEFVNHKLPPKTVYETLIHPTAIIGTGVDIGEGTVIQANTHITVDSQIGKHCLLNYYSHVSHDCILYDFVTLGPKAGVNGHCVIGDNVYLGASSSVRDRIVITHDVFVGIGGIVVKDIYKEGTYIGNPAKLIKNK